MRARLVPTAAAALVSVSGLSAQPVQTNVPEVVKAVEDCASSMADTTLDDALLLKRGWFKVDVEMSNNPLPQTPVVYGKSEQHPLIRVVVNPVGNTGCMVEGWFASESDEMSLIPALTEQFGEPIEVAGLNVTDMTSGTSLEDGSTAFRAGEAVVLPLEGAMLGQSDFRIIVTLPGVAK